MGPMLLLLMSSPQKEMFYFTLQVCSMVCLQNHAYTPNQWQPCFSLSRKAQDPQNE